jgi:hypothetical protein
MKRILAVAILSLSMVGCANAQHRGGHHHGHHHHGGGWGWAVPVLIGGAIVYGATRPADPAPQVIIQTPPPGAIQCPPGLAAFYNRVLTPDPYGRYIETYQFAGCR